MKITSRSKHSLRSGVLLGGFLFLFAALPGAAHAEGWGFSFNIPFLGFQIGGPHGHYVYDEYGCPVYYYRSGYGYPHGWHYPPPVEVESDRQRDEVNSDTSDRTDNPRLEVESRSSRYEPPERNTIPPRISADEYVGPGFSVENQRDDRIGMMDRKGTTDNPNVEPRDRTDRSAEEAAPQDPPTDATPVEEEQPEESKELIPLSGVN